MRKLAADALTSKLQRQNTLLIVANPDLILPDPDNPELGLVKLHAAVGMAILLHRMTPVAKLPSKSDKFDWTLGPDVKILQDRYDADYALFVRV